MALRCAEPRSCFGPAQRPHPKQQPAAGIEAISELMTGTLRHHWPEYVMEAAELGVFMISAGVFAFLLDHPSSVIRQAVPDPVVRRMITGLLMGATAISIVHSPWGRQSGAHMNPSMT